MLIRFLSFICVLTICISSSCTVVWAIENTEYNINALPIIDTLVSSNNSEQEEPKILKCEDQKFYEKTLTQIRDYSSSITSTSTLAKRQRALLLANIDGFETVNIKNLTPQTDRNTANALIMLKINKHLKDTDFIVCKQIGNNKVPLYLIGYLETNNYMVHIINLDPYSDNYEKISFTYP